MRILISGGAGFIGSHVVDRMLSKNNDVLVVDNFATGSPDNVPNRPGLKVINYTIVDGEWLNLAMSNFKPDVVIHAAASYKNPSDWCNDIRTNVEGTANIVKACQANNVDRLIYFNTALCYGLQPLLPTPITHPLAPEGTSYAITKTAGELIIQMSSLDWVSFRLANTIGARNISGPVPAFYQRLKSQKPVLVSQTRREFIFVGDLVDLVEMAVNGVGHGAYNASRGKDYPIEAVLKSVCQAMKIDIPPYEVKPMGADDTYTILLSPAKTKADFGWEAATSLDMAIENAIFWYEGHGIGETYTHLRIRG